MQHLVQHHAAEFDPLALTSSHFSLALQPDPTRANVSDNRDNPNHCTLLSGLKNMWEELLIIAGHDDLVVI